MKHAIKVIAFDADDTLWSNEPFFQEVERKYTDLLSEYGSTEEISAELFKTEMGNLECLGYGAKAFTISSYEKSSCCFSDSEKLSYIKELMDIYHRNNIVIPW